VVSSPASDGYAPWRIGVAGNRADDGGHSYPVRIFICCRGIYPLLITETLVINFLMFRSKRLNTANEETGTVVPLHGDSLLTQDVRYALFFKSRCLSDLFAPGSLASPDVVKDYAFPQT
jgi:hypothetical protein